MLANFDIALLIGRFQPFHMGHLALLQKALETAPKVVVLLGSAFQAHSPRNPFSHIEREAMIRSTLTPEQQERVLFVAQRDCWDTPKWIQATRHTIFNAVGNARIAVVGHQKVQSQVYLQNFPNWGYVAAGYQGDVNATQIRTALFAGNLKPVQNWLPPTIYSHLNLWLNTSLAQEIIAENQAIIEYQVKWGKGPFVTCDALVECCGHILLIQRGRRPGLGLHALPGGFLEVHESFSEGALRELQEETGLELSEAEKVPFQSLIFAHPERSLRARIITQVVHFKLQRPSLPQVQGADDAARAFWVPISQLPDLESKFFEDHAHIIAQFL